MNVQIAPPPRRALVDMRSGILLVRESDHIDLRGLHRLASDLDGEIAVTATDAGVLIEARWRCMRSSGGVDVTFRTLTTSPVMTLWRLSEAAQFGGLPKFVRPSRVTIEEMDGI